MHGLTVEHALPADAAARRLHPRDLRQRLVVGAQHHRLAPPAQHCAAVARVRHQQLVACEPRLPSARAAHTPYVSQSNTDGFTHSFQTNN